MRGFMSFEQFSSSRDFLYLAALLLGCGIGCILNRLKKNCSARSRNLTVTAAFFLLSGVLAALTLALIYSGGMILFEPDLFLPLGISVLPFILAFRFPRAAGFPLILVLGVFVVWIAYVCVSFPLSGNAKNERRVSQVIHTEHADDSENGTPEKKGLAHILLVHSSETETDYCFPKAFPVVGGMGLNLISEIRKSSNLLYANPL